MLGRLASKNVAARALAAKCAIETDSGDRPDDGGKGVELGDLPVRIEEGDEKEPGKSAGEGPQRDLDGDEDRPARTAVRISQMPLASGTCGHRTAEGTGANDTTAISGP